MFRLRQLGCHTADTPGTTVTKILSTGELTQIGIENLRIHAPAQSDH
jgi:hypothetical protein